MVKTQLKWGYYVNKEKYRTTNKVVFHNSNNCNTSYKDKGKDELEGAYFYKKGKKL